MTHVRLENIAKSFGDKHVLKGVDLDIQRGEIIYIIGKSGSGKSVTLKNITGLLRPDSGRVLIDGADVHSLGDAELNVLRKKMGVLFQMAALFDSMSVYENVAFAPRRFTTMREPEIRELVREKLEMVGLRGVEHLNPSSLSGGMQKRVALARAIAADPEIIFFDEPTTGLDPIMADVINNLIVDCVKRLGATTVSITHDVASARKIADDIAMIFKGEIIWQGPANTIDESGNAYVDQFIHGRAEGPIQMDVLKP